MLADWWKAHRLEIFIDLGGVIVVVVVIAALLIWERVKSRRAKEQRPKSSQ